METPPSDLDPSAASTWELPALVFSNIFLTSFPWHHSPHFPPPSPAIPSQPPSPASPLLNDAASKSRVLGSLSLSICSFFLIYLFSPKALYGIYILLIPKFTVSDQTFPAPDSYIQLFLISLCGCHRGISNLAYLMWDSWVTILPPEKKIYFSYNLPHLSKWHHHPTSY